MLTSYLSGSQRSYLGGSQTWYLGGSQRGYLTGSQRRYLGGGQGEYINGSQKLLSDDKHLDHENNDVYSENELNAVNVPAPQRFEGDWNLIDRKQRPGKQIGGNATFGYGLDLI
jgi:hypothetical protein